MDFSNTLLQWYNKNKRELPWRLTKNPYKVWLSEIMLQQTRVAQGLPYYIRFINAFPTIQDLANADEEKVLKLWQGLGYYSRARNLHATAKYISNELKGKFPNNFNELLKLKGIGDYTAAAIASISFEENVAVVDGNVFRVLSRYFGIEEDISLHSTRKKFQKLANELLPKEKAGNFNQAIMDFGAIQCTPKKPNCNNCVFNNSCYALQNKKIETLPYKSKKNKIKKRYFNYFIVIDINGNILVEKRESNDIWKNLFQFTLIETEKKTAYPQIKKIITEKYPSNTILLLNEKTITHKLSHQELYINFYKINVSEIIENALPLNEIIEKPFPIVIHNFIETYYPLLIKK